MTRLGLGRMPHIASNVVDEPAVKLVEKWIAEMKQTLTPRPPAGTSPERAEKIKAASHAANLIASALAIAQTNTAATLPHGQRHYV